MKFVKILIKEGRKEDLKKKYSNDFEEDELDFVLNIADLQDFNHKYTDWVLKQIKGYADVYDGAEVMVELVKDFDKYQKNLDKKDINQYSNFEELESALKPFRAKERERVLESQAEKIYEDDNFLVLVPKTQEASCKYGAGTKWCTTVKNSDHFQRYTRGKQGLYYILRKKGKDTDSHYKVAIHFDDTGSEKWWDAKDRPMTDSSIELFKEYFPDVYRTIWEHDDEKRKIGLKDLDSIFSIQDQEIEVYENFHRVANKDLKIMVTGYDLIPDMPGKAIGKLVIYLNNDILDEYDVFVNSLPKGRNQWTASVGFSEDFDEEPKFDFKFWQGWGVDFTMTTQETPEVLRRTFDRNLIYEIYKKIYSNKDFYKRLLNITGPTWTPDRLGYGYTFKENKGLIKKLINWLDAQRVGTKLDFLTDIGVFDKVTLDGKTKFKRPNSDYLYKSSELRGQFSGFFASAKLAGILDYRKEGKDYFLIKGPNFEAFKEGKLKAL